MIRNALRTAFAAVVLAGGMVVLAGVILFDYLTDPRPYPMGPRRRP